MTKQNQSWNNIFSFIKRCPIILLVIVAFVVGYGFHGAVYDTVSTAQPDQYAEQQTDTEWTCSMHPEIRMPEPGSCPKCGMDLIPVKAKAAKPKKKTRYACAMICLPPMEEPGECPVCGMDMVPVDTGEMLDDGSDAPILTMSKAARQLAKIQTAPVKRQFVTNEVRMVGKIEYDETRIAYLTAWVPGRLDRLYVDYTGVEVQQGDHMVKLYSPELLSAQEELLQAIHAVDDLKNADIKSLRDSALNMVEASRERLRLWGITPQQIKEIEKRGTPTDHLTIFAPIGGIVIVKHAMEGMYVKTGMRIYTIADLSHVWVKLDAYESDLAWLRYGQKIEFHTEAYPGETFRGTIAFIDPILNKKTRTVKVRVNVDNSDGRLKPEMFVRAIVHSQIAAGGKVMDSHLSGKWICSMHPEIVKEEAGTCDLCEMALKTTESLGYAPIEVDPSQTPLVIPATAPLITGRRAVVYIQLPDDEGKFEGREIVLGPRAGDYYIVREGLAEDELVVVNGNFKIDSALQIMAKPSMMNPKGGEKASAGGHHHD